jgi:hypothetical protein
MEYTTNRTYRVGLLVAVVAALSGMWAVAGIALTLAHIIGFSPQTSETF